MYCRDALFFGFFFAQTYTLTVIRVRCEKIDVCEVGLDNQLDSKIIKALVR